MMRKERSSCLRGITAQRRFCARGVRRPHWDSDFNKVVELALGVSMGNEVEAERWIEARQGEASALVEAHWPTIVALADRLLERVEMSGREVAVFLIGLPFVSLPATKPAARIGSAHHREPRQTPLLPGSPSSQLW